MLLTDGQTTEGEPLSKAAELAARRACRSITIGLGSAEPARDLELTELLVDDVVFVDDAVRFQAKLLARGFAGPEDRASGSRSATRASTDPKAARELETIEVDAPADGQPKRVELVHRPKTTGERTFILEVDPQPRELQTENNRIERAVTVRKEKLKVLLVDSEPRYEFRYLKNYLEREETIDLSVVLLSSDPEYSEQDRSALPTFPAAKDELFAYDVVIFGDADPSFLSQSQMQNLAEFVTEKGGGILFIAGELFNPLAYRGTPLETLLPIELAEARNPTAVGNAITSFRPELTVEGRSSPIFRFGEDEAASAQIWQDLPELYWYLEAPRKKPAALVLAEHPTVDRHRRQAAADPLPVRRRGQGDVPRLRRHLAMAVPRGRPLLRPVLGPDDPVPGPVQAGRPAAGRDPDRPPPLPARPADPAPGPVPEPRRSPRRTARSSSRSSARAPSPRKLTLNRLPGTPQRLRGGAAPGRRGRLRGPAPAAAGPRRPDPDDRVPGRRPGQRVRADPDERARADPGRRGDGGQVLHAADRRRPCSRTCPSRRRSRSTPTRRSRSGTPGRCSPCSWHLITLEWVLRKRRQMV